jgi:hypothetical protein
VHVAAADLEAIHNLCSILTLMLQKSCQIYNCNTKLSGVGGLAVSMLASGMYLSSRVQTRPKPSYFSGVKILSMPFFGGKVKPSVPCRKVVARQRTQQFHGSRIVWLNLTGISRPYFLLSEQRSLTWCGAPLEINGRTKTGLKVQTASKAEVR